MSSDNHNEKFKLLGVSGSDSGSDIPEFVIPKRKVKTKKKHRANGTARQNILLQRRNCSPILVLKVLALLIAVISFGIIVWFSVNLHLRVDELRGKISHVPNPSQFVNTQVTNRLFLKLDSSSKLNGTQKTGKKMKKRKELDALVPNGKVKKKSGSSSGAELLHGVHGSDTTDTEEFSVIQPRKFSHQKGACLTGLRAACVPMCTMTLFAACVVGSGTLIWMQFGMRQEVDLLRDHVRQVEESGKSLPSEFQDFHSQLNELQKNHTSLKEGVDQLNKTLESISKEISALRKTTADIQKSIADAPQLETLPKQFESLSQNLASLGSQFTELKTNLDVAQAQLSTNEKDKLEWQKQIADIQKKIDAVSVPDKAGDANVYAYVNNEVKKLDDIMYETNSSIWEKLNLVTEGLHDHQQIIEATKSVSQNLTARVSKLESTTAFGNVSDVYEQAILKVNQSVISAMNNYLPAALSSLKLVDNGTVALSTLVNYVQNLTRVYIALLANLKSASNSPIKSLNDTLDVDILATLQSQVHQAVDSSLGEQNVKITELFASLQQLNNTLEELKTVTKSTQSSSNIPVVAGQITSSPPPVMTPPAQPHNDTTTAVPQNPAVSTNVTAGVNTSAASGEAQSSTVQDTPSLAGGNVNSSGLVTNSNGTTTSSVNVTTTPAVILKPSQTGLSLNQPGLRPDSPPPD